MSISPDGLSLAYTRDEGLEQSLWVKRIDSGNETQLLTADTVNFSVMEFSPDDISVFRPFRKKQPCFRLPVQNSRRRRNCRTISSGCRHCGQLLDKAENVETRCSLLDRSEPARSNSRLQASIRESARLLGLATTDMPSFAGHDAQEIARIAPVGMIFVPSKDSVSRSPKEFTSWQDVANGTEVLYRLILLLDRN